MIALWLLYGCALGGLLGLGALAIERVAALLHAPTRWAWLGALVATVALPATLALRPQIAPPAAAVASVTQTTQLPSGSGAVVTSHRPPRSSAATLDSLTTPLLVAWALGAVLLAGTLLGGWVAQRQARRRWRRIAVESRQVLVAPDVGPAVVGARRLEIVLPEWAVAGDATALRMMLRHEEQHVQARDPNLLLVAAAALVLMPWNLALWWLTRRLRLAIEVDCDGRVLRLGEDVHGYGSLLLDVASRCGGAVLLPGAAFSESASQLRRRIEAISAPEPSRPILRACVFGTLCAAAVVLACAAPRPQSIWSSSPAGQLFPAASALHRPPPASMVTREQMTAAIARYFPDVLRGDTGMLPLQFVLDIDGRVVSISRGYGADSLYPDERVQSKHGENALAGIYGPAPVRVQVRWLKPDSRATSGDQLFSPYVPRIQPDDSHSREQMTAAIAHYFPYVLRGDTGVMPLQFVLDIDGRIASTSRGRTAQALYPDERVKAYQGENRPAGYYGPAPVRVEVRWLKPDSLLGGVGR